MEMEEIIKILIAVLVLVIMVGIFVMFKDNMVEIWNSIKDILRFGR